MTSNLDLDEKVKKFEQLVAALQASEILIDLNYDSLDVYTLLVFG